MIVCSLASGSDGNCVYVADKDSAILVDAGISCKRIEENLRSIGSSPELIKGIMITHEHIDHIRGIGIFVKKWNVKIYGTMETIISARKNPDIAKLPKELFVAIKPDSNFMIDNFLIEPYSTKHDAAAPVGYSIISDDKKCGIATDLGCFDEYTVEKLVNADVLYLEANHDENMLMVGRYPYHLKQRILGSFGHLSNDACAKLACKLLNDKLKYILLAHLSKENNYPELAYETVRLEVKKNLPDDFNMPYIEVANRNIPSIICEV